MPGQSTGRDPKFWERAEEFLPERFVDRMIDFRGQHFQYVPFVVERRACPGLTFGIVTVEFVIANLLYWFDWKLPCEGAMGRDLDMSEVNGLTVHKKIPLHLVPIPYSLIHHSRDC